jgi:hypothetical protein
LMEGLESGKPKNLRIRNTGFIDCQWVLRGKGLLSAAGIVIYTVQFKVRITIHVLFVHFVQTKKNCHQKDSVPFFIKAYLSFPRILYYFTCEVLPNKIFDAGRKLEYKGYKTRF